MNKNLNFFILATCLFFFTNVSLASYKSDQDSQLKNKQERKYDRSFRRNYKKYRAYNPKKKKRVQQKWNSFKKGTKWQGLTPEQKRKLRERVLNKKKPN